MVNVEGEYIYMKISSFNPLVVSRDSSDLVKLFEELGFKQIHNPENVNETGASDTNLKDDNGFRVDVAQINDPIPQDMTFIKMNVDNFEEAYEILTRHGFKNTRGDNTLDNPTSKSATMVSPTGLIIALVHHVK